MPLDTSNDHHHYVVTNRPAPETRAENFRHALVHLHRAGDEPRYGDNYRHYLGLAALRLELAGRFDLAQRCVAEAREPGELPAIERDVKAAFEAEAGRWNR